MTDPTLDMMNPVLRVDDYGIRLAYLHRRRWWQLWMPRQWLQGVAEVKYHVRTNDQVRLLRAGDAHIVTVNGEKVLTWSPPKGGFGMAMRHD